MKKNLLAIFLSLMFLLSGCRPTLSVNSPMMEKAPDVIIKPTKTIISKETVGELPKNTWIKTDPQEKVEVKLEEDTVVTLIQPIITPIPEIISTPKIEDESIKNESTLNPPKVSTLEKPVQIILPKNTPVILPENTYLQTSDQAKVIMEAQTEVTLPIGTEISITKVNWYAILFYLVVVLGLAYYYLQGKTEDKDGDGFIDESDKKENKEETKT